ncbi:MAG: hypothetical protein WA631_11220 [Nitrososphaeraceae archaeon]
MQENRSCPPAELSQTTSTKIDVYQYKLDFLRKEENDDNYDRHDNKAGVFQLGVEYCA